MSELPRVEELVNEWVRDSSCKKVTKHCNEKKLVSIKFEVSRHDKSLLSAILVAEKQGNLNFFDGGKRTSCQILGPSQFRPPAGHTYIPTPEGRALSKKIEEYCKHMLNTAGTGAGAGARGADSRVYLHLYQRNIDALSAIGDTLLGGHFDGWNRDYSGPGEVDLRVLRPVLHVGGEVELQLVPMLLIPDPTASKGYRQKTLLKNGGCASFSLGTESSNLLSLVGSGRQAAGTYLMDNGQLALFAWKHQVVPGQNAGAEPRIMVAHDLPAPTIAIYDSLCKMWADGRLHGSFTSSSEAEDISRASILQLCREVKPVKTDVFSTVYELSINGNPFMICKPIPSSVETDLNLLLHEMGTQMRITLGQVRYAIGVQWKEENRKGYDISKERSLLGCINIDEVDRSIHVDDLGVVGQKERVKAELRNTIPQLVAGDHFMSMFRKPVNSVLYTPAQTALLKFITTQLMTHVPTLKGVSLTTVVHWMLEGVKSYRSTLGDEEKKQRNVCTVSSASTGLKIKGGIVAGKSIQVLPKSQMEATWKDFRVVLDVLGYIECELKSITTLSGYDVSSLWEHGLSIVNERGSTAQVYGDGGRNRSIKFVASKNGCTYMARNGTQLWKKVLRPLANFAPDTAVKAAVNAGCKDLKSNAKPSFVWMGITIVPYSSDEHGQFVESDLA